VVRWAWEVPLGITHDLRRVGGLCAPNRTSAPALPGTSEPAARSGVDSGMSVARALLQLRKPARVRLAAFLAVLDGSKTSRAAKIFFRKKNGHMGVHSCGSSNTAKNLFSAQLDFPRSRTAKKAPQPTQACFHCCSSALATVLQLPQPWTPRCPFFLRKKLFSAQLDFSPSITAKKTPKTTRACFHSYSSALATVFQLPQLWAN